MDNGFEEKTEFLLNLLHHLGLAEDSNQLNILLQKASSRESVVDSNGNPSNLFKEDSLLKLGEIPAVQDRFHALLQRRLLVEAHRNPPLFPWEKEIEDYESEPTNDEVTNPVFATASVWMNQIRHLQLPVPMPESVLTELLTRCQSVLFSSLREGAKLVRAVDALFPEQTPMLNNLAGYVMVSPARSSSVSLQQLAAEEGVELPHSYEDAIGTQQMTLSLLAAREIMSTLTITVSPKQSQQEREWLTELGAFTLRTEYEFAQGTPCLRIDAELPCGGSLRFQGNDFRTLADRDDAGYLRLEIRDFELDRPYPLEVRLGEQDLLTFAVCPMSEA